jgi:hypothetical protein
MRNGPIAVATAAEPPTGRIVPANARRGLLPADWEGDAEELVMDFSERRG